MTPQLITNICLLVSVAALFGLYLLERAQREMLERHMDHVDQTIMGILATLTHVVKDHKGAGHDRTGIH